MACIAIIVITACDTEKYPRPTASIQLIRGIYFKSLPMTDRCLALQLCLIIQSCHLYDLIIFDYNSFLEHHLAHRVFTYVLFV